MAQWLERTRKSAIDGENKHNQFTKYVEAVQFEAMKEKKRARFKHLMEVHNNDRKLVMAIMENDSN